MTHSSGSRIARDASRKGLLAGFLVLRADPTARIRHTRQIEWVIRESISRL
jgi:hypothetical protein